MNKCINCFVVRTTPLRLSIWHRYMFAMWPELQARNGGLDLDHVSPVFLTRLLPLLPVPANISELALSLDVSAISSTQQSLVDHGALILSVGFFLFLFFWTLKLVILDSRKYKCLKIPYGHPSSYNSLSISFLPLHPLSSSDFQKSTFKPGRGHSHPEMSLLASHALSATFTFIPFKWLD